jgi:hypothetical protein
MMHYHAVGIRSFAGMNEVEHSPTREALTKQRHPFECEPMMPLENDALLSRPIRKFVSLHRSDRGDESFDDTSSSLLFEHKQQITSRVVQERESEVPLPSFIYMPCFTLDLLSLFPWQDRIVCRNHHGLDRSLCGTRLEPPRKDKQCIEWGRRARRTCPPLRPRPN